MTDMFYDTSFHTFLQNLQKSWDCSFQEACVMLRDNYGLCAEIRIDFSVTCSNKCAPPNFR